ncbi:MAG: NAD-dependent epimerase/dehydratase family protein [Bacteroidetes bacterium]|nr:NAD-dependent epimerase/dehydratase family protein [Bacteroidota bacterium]
MNEVKKVLITGATGLVGSHLLHALIKKNIRVKAIYHQTKPDLQPTENVEWVQADLSDIPSVENMMQDVQQIYHCAGLVSYDPRDRQALFKTNVEGTAHVINAAIQSNIEKIVYVSSVSALGRLREKELVNETMYWTKETSNSEYGRTKFLAEMEVWRGIGEGLNAVIVNPSIILGAGNWNVGSTAIFKKAFDEFPWHTSGVTGIVDVLDLVESMQCLMNSNISEQRFIINAENVLYKDLFTQIAAVFHKRPPFKKVTPLMASLVWRMEFLKSRLSGAKPLLTKETAHTAMAKVFFDNSKFLKKFPAFRYTPISTSIHRICTQLLSEINK